MKATQTQKKTAKKGSSKTGTTTPKVAKKSPAKKGSVKAVAQDTPSVRVGKSSAGLGLFALRDFKKGEQVIEYVGVRLKGKEADEVANLYLFEVSSRLTIDGSSRENKARYINHACDPNCETEIKNARVFVQTVRPIKAGEEFTYDYGTEYVDFYIKPKGCKCASCIQKMA